MTEAVKKQNLSRRCAAIGGQHPRQPYQWVVGTDCVVGYGGHGGQDVEDRVPPLCDSHGGGELGPHPPTQTGGVSKAHHQVKVGHGLTQSVQRSDPALYLRQQFQDDSVNRETSLLSLLFSSVTSPLPDGDGS